MKHLVSLLSALLLLTLCSNTATAQGVLTNGWTYGGTIAPVGHSDTWTFSATSGDSIVIRVGKITSTNSFTPRIRLYNPTAAQQALASDPSAAEIAVTATNTGTFTVIVDDAVGTTATGTYRLTLAKTGDPIVVAPGYQGGPMTNGFTYSANMPIGDLGVWSLTTTNGQAIVVRAGESSDTNNFAPWVRLYGPNGVLLGSNDALGFGEVAVQATNSGTFLVVIANNPYYSSAGNGTYLLTLAETGSPVVVAPGYQGGPLTNGFTYQAIMPAGLLSVWDFTATAGEAIVVRAGQASGTNNFLPWVRLYGPDGALLGSNDALGFGEVAVQATNSGTFLVVIGNNAYYSGFGGGTYLLTLAQTGNPIVVAPGYQGGPITNGFTYQADMPAGLLNVWDFTATAGEAIVVRAGEMISTNNFVPWVRLYGPDGALLGSNDALGFAEVAVRATNSGTFLVVVGNNAYYSGFGGGTYLLTLAQTGSPLVIAPGYPGGPMTNGFAYQANMPIGELNAWDFTATAGEAIVLRAAEMSSTNNFLPWVRLYGPDGALLGLSYGLGFGEVTVQATNSGTFLVVIGNNPYYSVFGSGNYLLTLAQTGSPLVIAPGYPGGSLTGAGVYSGNMPIGQIDPWTFTICAGEPIDVRVDEITSTNNFVPWVRLYGPNGALLGSSFGLAFGEVSLKTTNSGRFLVVIANNPYYSDYGSGTYQLTVNGLSDGFKACVPVISGTNVNLGGVGGPPGTNFVLYTTTNVATAGALWTPILTNQFDQFGVFEYTNGFSRAEPQRYYRLEHP